jgi:hypothetical protein
MKNKKTQWYKLEVTEEHLQIIQKSVEAVSRAKIAQWGDIIELILEDFNIVDYEFKSRLEKMINEEIEERLQGIKGKVDNESYQLYRDINHYFALENDPKGEGMNVYRHDFVVSKKPRIKIKEIKTK